MKYFDGIGLTVEGGEGGQLPAEVLGQAKKLGYELRAETQARGLHALRKYSEIEGGGYMYGLKHGDIVRVHVVLPPPEKEEPRTPVSMPDFASAILGQSIIWHDVTPQVMREVYPTKGTQRRLGMPEGPVATTRFNIPPPLELGIPWMPNSRNMPSQYAVVQSSQFSGKMKALVQAVMGYGIPGRNFKDLLTLTPDQEGRLNNPTAWERRCANGVPILYDSTFYRTHGVVAGLDKKLWLCQISPKGVHVMKVKYFPFTDTPEFYRAIEARADEEALLYLDTFGGFPNGESFPLRDKDFAAAKRAGVIYELLPDTVVAQAYACMPRSSGLGWAFNESGTEAHHVLYEWGPDDLQFTQHFHFQFSSIAERAPINNDETTQGLLLAIFSELSDVSAEYRDIVISKLPWVPEAQLRGILSTARSSPKIAWDELDQIEVRRNTGTCAMGKGSKETVWWPGRFYAAPPFKVHEPMLPGLQNVTFRKLGYQYVGIGRVPKVMDVLVHVYFLGDTLKALRWYTDLHSAELSSEESNTFEDCMYNGSWTSDRKWGAITYPSNRFYLDDMDAREAYVENTEHKTITTKYAGVDRPGAGFDPAYPNRGVCSRTHRFTRRTVTERKGPPPAYGMAAAVNFIVPYGVREGVLCGKTGVVSATNGWTVHDRFEWFREYDPWAYDITRCAYYGDVKAYYPWGIPLSEVLTWTDEDWAYINQFPIPFYYSLFPSCAGTWHREGRVNGVNFNPGPCSDIWDRGSWLELCDAIPRSWYEPIDPLPDMKETYTGGGEIVYKFDVYADFPPLGGMTLVHTREWKPEGENIYPPWDASWGYPSPDMYGEVQQCWGTFNCFGESDLVVGQTGPNGYGDGIFKGVPLKGAFNRFVSFVGAVDGSP